MTSEFSRLLRELRTARGMSQWRLGRAIGSDHSIISRLESGARRPSRRMVVRLARVLAGDDSELAARLLAAAGYAPVPVDALSEVGRAWRLIALMSDDRLPDSARRLAISVIDGLAQALQAEIERHILLGNGSVANTSEGGDE